MCHKMGLCFFDLPWRLADLCEEVVVLASKLKVSSALIKWSVNGVANALDGLAFSLAGLLGSADVRVHGAQPY